MPAGWLWPKWRKLVGFDDPGGRKVRGGGAGFGAGRSGKNGDRQPRPPVPVGGAASPRLPIETGGVKIRVAG